MAAPSARLALDPSVRSAFGSGSHRSVHLRVEGESLVLRKTSGSLGSPCAESFDGLGAEVEGGEAEFVLFSLDGSEGGKGKWLLSRASSVGRLSFIFLSLSKSFSFSCSKRCSSFPVRTPFSTSLQMRCLS